MLRSSQTILYFLWNRPCHRSDKLFSTVVTFPLFKYLPKTLDSGNLTKRQKVICTLLDIFLLLCTGAGWISCWQPLLVQDSPPPPSWSKWPHQNIEPKPLTSPDPPLPNANPIIWRWAPSFWNSMNHCFYSLKKKMHTNITWDSLQICEFFRISWPLPKLPYSAHQLAWPNSPYKKTKCSWYKTVTSFKLLFSDYENNVYPTHYLYDFNDKDVKMMVTVLRWDFLIITCL